MCSMDITKTERKLTKRQRATLALSTVTKLAGTAKSEYVQLEASKDLLDRAGFKAPDKHMHLHAGDIRVEIDLG